MLYPFFEVHLQHRFLHEDLPTQSNLQGHIPFIVMLFANPPHLGCRGLWLQLCHHSCSCMRSLCFEHPFPVLGIAYFSAVVIWCLALLCCMVFCNFDQDVPFSLACFYMPPKASPSSLRIHAHLTVWDSP